MTVLSTSAVLLRAYPYSETSQILRYYTESNGVMGVMARGARRAGRRGAGAFSTFSEGILDVHYRENRDLQTFREFSATRARMGLARDPIRLAGASVLAELILQHAESEGNPEIFHRLRLGLDAAETQELETLLPELLAHLWSLIGGLGFKPLVTSCVQCGRTFGKEEVVRFDYGAGGAICSSCQGQATGPRLGPVARTQLQALQSGSPPPGLVRPLGHLRLASDFITYHVSGGTPLKSMTVLANLTTEKHA